MSDEALRASGLSRADLSSSKVQSALEAIGLSQVDRLGPVLDDLSGHAAILVEGGVIRLDDRFDAGLRDDVVRWSGSPQFRTFVERIWPQLAPALQQRPVAPAAPADATDPGHQWELDRLFTAIAEERHLLAKEKGLPVVAPGLLERFGLAPADVVGDLAGKRLAELAERQTTEVSQMSTYVRQAPHHFVQDGEGWLLDDPAPADIRELVAAWRADATIQQAIGRALGARMLEALPVDAAPRECGVPPADQSGAAWLPALTLREQAITEDDAIKRLDKGTGSAWRQGRQSRETAMAAWDENERLDGAGIARPGLEIPRPGLVSTQVQADRMRKSPGAFGDELGDWL